MTTKPIRREKLTFDDAEALQALCGSNNARLKLVERTAGAQVHLRGNEITIEGEDPAAETAKSALEQLYDLALTGKALSSDDVVRAVKLLQGDGGGGAGGAGVTIRGVFGETILTPRAGRPIGPKGATQKAYVDLVRSNDIVFAIGPAGTGKTYLAMALAVRTLFDKQVRRIILTRPAVEAGERLGFLPGTLEEKVDPYLRPLHDALHDMIDADKLERFMTDGTIEVAPLAFMRGRTLNDSFIVLDEAQNTTPEQMKMFLTRMGFGSKAVVTGDITQTDLPRGQKSGLRDALELVEGIRGIGRVTFSDQDVVRHPLVAALIRAYDRRDRARFEAREGSSEAPGGEPSGGDGREGRDAHDARPRGAPASAAGPAAAGDRDRSREPLGEPPGEPDRG
ncbi:MAG TPA: PhoH family protein [Kofleriaceae bacterium]|nr:PhoH family protein [Kofleriaceae bacterium]